MSDPTSGSVFEDKPQETPAQQQAPSQEQQPQQTAQPSQEAPAPTASSDNLFADQLASIKNERGEPKYRDLPTALEALKHSQEYIPQVKQENETLTQEIERLKSELEKRESVESTLERFTAQKEEAPSSQELQGLTEEQVADLLDQRLTQREQQQAKHANAQQVEQAILQRYGEKAREVVAAKADEYGMTASELQQWAQEKPKAVLALFDVKSTSPQGSNSTSSVNIPPTKPEKPSLERPEKSLMSGATDRERADYMAKVRRATYERLGINQ